MVEKKGCDLISYIPSGPKTDKTTVGVKGVTYFPGKIDLIFRSRRTIGLHSKNISTNLYDGMTNNSSTGWFTYYCRGYEKDQKY